MKKSIKIFLNVSYILLLSVMVSLVGFVSGGAHKGSRDKDGGTVQGNDLLVNSDLYVNVAYADVPIIVSGDDDEGTDDY